MSENIRVLVADESPFLCRYLAAQLQRFPGLEVVGMALCGARALELTRELRPDVVTLAVQLPDMNGLQVLKRIMHECPTPVLVLSGISRKAAEVTLEAIELGAVDFIFKFQPELDVQPEVLLKEIVSKVRAASKIRVVRSLQRRPAQAPLEPGLVSRPAGPREEGVLLLPGGVVVIGASTGGPVAVRELLSHLPREFPAAIIIVQHLPAAFTRVFAEHLGRHVPMRVREAKNGDLLEPGTALVAPGDFQMLLRSDSLVRLIEGKQTAGHCPSIDVTMQSVAQVGGARTSGVLLTGMGEDGVKGLLAIRSKGGRTYVQDAASCVINGMPQRAIETGVAEHVAPPAEIARLLISKQPRAQSTDHVRPRKNG